MMDSEIITQLIEKEISSYKNKTGKIQKLLYENCDTDLLDRVKSFLDFYLKNIRSFEEDQEKFEEKLFQFLEWDLYD